jgi:hypothetical protein
MDAAVLNHGSPPPTSAAVTGQYLAKAHLTYRQLVKLAAALSTGAAVLTPMTIGQSAALVGVPVADVSRARRRNGKPLGNGRNGHAETLAEHISRSTAAERLEAARVLGIENVWDQMISPVLAEERSAAGDNSQPTA